jgi:hypothetical protein
MLLFSLYFVSYLILLPRYLSDEHRVRIRTRCMVFLDEEDDLVRMRRQCFESIATDSACADRGHKSDCCRQTGPHRLS